MEFKFTIDKDGPEQVVVTARERTALIDQLEALVLSYEKTDRITGYTEEDLRILKFSEIECISVLDGKTVAIDTRGKQYRLKYRLYELEKLLPTSFIRINKSSFANENRIRQFSATFSGAVDVIFQCGYREYVSRRCFAAIKRRYD